MKIRNEKAFSEDVGKALRIYYEWLIENMEEEYKENKEDIKSIDFFLKIYETEVNVADKILNFIYKYGNSKILKIILINPNKALDVLEKFINKKAYQLEELEEDKYEEMSFNQLYEKLVENGLVIVPDGENTYTVRPYTGGIYRDLENSLEHNSSVIRIKNN